MIKVMLVDDHDLVRTGLKRLINDVEGFQIVAEASSGEEALYEANNKSIDIILMDININGDIDGIEASYLIQEKYLYR